IAAMIGGWNIGPFVITPLCAFIAIALTYALARELGLERGYAIGAAAILAAYPTFIMQAVQVMSDVPATMWALAAIVLSLRSRRHWSAGVLAGAAFGIAVAVRPTNILLAIPIAIAMRFRIRHLPRALIGVWFMLFLAYYALWPVCDAWWYTRFLLPATPPLIIGAMFLLRDVLGWTRWRPAIAAAVIVILIFIPARETRKLHVLDMK